MHCYDGQDGAEERRFLESHRSASQYSDKKPCSVRVLLARSASFNSCDHRDHGDVSLADCNQPIYRADPLPRHCRIYAIAAGAALLGIWPTRYRSQLTLADHFLSARRRKSTRKACLSHIKHDVARMSQREIHSLLTVKAAFEHLASLVSLSKQG